MAAWPWGFPARVGAPCPDGARRCSPVNHQAGMEATCCPGPAHAGCRHLLGRDTALVRRDRCGPGRGQPGVGDFGVTTWVASRTGRRRGMCCGAAALPTGLTCQPGLTGLTGCLCGRRCEPGERGSWARTLPVGTWAPRSDKPVNLEDGPSRSGLRQDRGGSGGCDARGNEGLECPHQQEGGVGQEPGPPPASAVRPTRGHLGTWA